MGKYVVAGILLLSIFGAGARWFYGAGVDATELRYANARQEATEADHTQYVAAVAWGSQVSATLAATQREIEVLRSRHDNYARRITGTCPDGLRVLHDAAAEGTDVPESAGQTTGSTATVAASDIGAAIAENYAAFRENAEQLESWITWCKGIKGCAPVSD
jgi:hypothetical protein